MTQLLCKIAAKFNTTLNLKTAIWATSATLDSATDDSGVALPTGRYALTIDGGTASEEFITCTLTSTALTSIKHVTMQWVETSGTTILHRKGATVKITDFAVIKKMLDLLDGTTSFDASTPLGYDGTATISTANQFATKAYVDGVAIAGAPDSSTTVKGIGKVSVAPISPTSPIFVGDNDWRVPTQGENDALVGTSGTPSSTNKYVTNDDTATAATADKVARRLAGGNITVVTESQANNSTNAASTAYVDTAKAAAVTAALAAIVYKNWTASKDAWDASTTQNIAHGLWAAPKFVSIEALIVQTSTNFPLVSKTRYNWTTQSSVSIYGSNTVPILASTFALNGSSSADGNQAWVVTWDATNIIITWTKTSSPTGTYTLLWNANT